MVICTWAGQCAYGQVSYLQAGSRETPFTYLKPTFHLNNNAIYVGNVNRKDKQVAQCYGFFAKTTGERNR